jgi:hypothetical protein
MFAPVLDGQTIRLSLYTNCLTTSDTLDSSTNAAGNPCLPPATWPGYVTQFGPSAFFISGKALTIDAAAGLSQGIVLDASAANAGCGPGSCFRFFDVDGGSALTLRGLTLRGGAGGGSALGAGGAIFNQGVLTVERCTLVGNAARGGLNGGSAGSGVGQDGSVGIGIGGPNGGGFGSNSGADGGFGGGGGYGVGLSGGAGGFGGDGGFGYLYGGNGGFGGAGGAGGSTISGTSWRGGVGGFGGGSGGKYAGGGSGGMGGAIFNDAGTVSLSNVTLSGNGAYGGGGYGGGSAYGGALFNYAGLMTLDFVTMSGNAVAAGLGNGDNDGSADGGAIYSLGDSAANCGTGGNTCNTGGAASLVVANTIAANSSGAATGDIVTSTINGGNSQYTPSATTLSGTQSLGDLPTALHGGLVDVMIPFGPATVGNAACDATVIDQRGVARPQPTGGNCDIGAVEARTGNFTLTVVVIGNGSVSGSPAPNGGGGIAGCASGGGVCSALFDLETSVTLTATTGALFAWGGDCAADGTVAMDADKTCKAIFRPALWTVLSNGESALGAIDCTVDANSDEGSCATLRGAIDFAISGDTIQFDHALDGTTIALTHHTDCLTAGDTLAGPNAWGDPCLPLSTWPGYVTQFGPSAFFIGGRTLTIDATANGLTRGVVIARDTDAADYGATGVANFRLFDVDSGGSLTLRGLTLAGGWAQGGASSHGGGALGAGGAVFNQGTLLLARCTLAGNTAQGGGYFGDNNVTGGGGVGQSAVDSHGGGPNGASAVNLGFFGGGGGGNDGSVFLYVNGGSGGFGGGGGVGRNSDPGGVGGDGGFGGGGGGGGADSNANTNAAGGIGGFGSGSGGIGGSGPGSNPGAGGGGAGMGGAIFNDAGTVILTNVTLTGNLAQGGLGSNNGSGYGGALFNYAGQMTLDFSTLSGNRVAAGSGAIADGGAIYSLGDSAANCGAGGNTCNAVGPTMAGTATLTIANTIAANSSGAATGDIVKAAINGGTSSWTASTTTLTGSAAFEGGMTELSGNLLGGLSDVLNPFDGNVIDKGSCDTIAIDQRGTARPQGAACDLGAVEVVDRIFADNFDGTPVP